MIPFLAGCILTFAAMSVWLWRRERKCQRRMTSAIDGLVRFGYELGRVDQHNILGSESAKEERVM